MGPLVVICIPTYNAASTLAQTIYSLLAQTYRNIEIHVSDNRSEDSTLDVLSTIGDPRLHVHAHEANVGAEGNFTRCMQLAGGAYTCIYHADDLYDPRIVETQVRYLEAHGDIESVMSQAWTIDDESKIIGHIDMIPSIRKNDVRVYSFLSLLKSILRHRNRLVISSLMVRTSVFKSHLTSWGGQHFRSASDVDMYLKLAQRAPLAVLGERLIRYRISEKQFSHRIRNRLERPDFFLVTDAYIDAHEDILKADDLRNHRWLQRHDAVARALNAAIVGDAALTRSLTRGQLSLDALRAAWSSRLGLVTLAAVVFLKSMSLFGLIKYSGRMIRWAKSRRWQ